MPWEKLITFNCSTILGSFILYFEVNDIAMDLSTARSRPAVWIQSVTAHCARLIGTLKSKGAAAHKALLYYPIFKELPS